MSLMLCEYSKNCRCMNYWQYLFKKSHGMQRGRLDHGVVGPESVQGHSEHTERKQGNRQCGLLRKRPFLVEKAEETPDIAQF